MYSNKGPKSVSSSLFLCVYYVILQYVKGSLKSSFMIIKRINQKNKKRKKEKKNIAKHPLCLNNVIYIKKLNKTK